MLENSKFKKGFTLLELIVGMAIVAILVALSILGIGIVQRSSRDAERRSTLEAINLEIINFYGFNSSYPSALTISGQTMTVGTNGKTITLSGNARNDTNMTPGNATRPVSAGGTRYCYTVTSGTTYSVGVGLEGVTWYNLGNAATKCSTPI